MGLNMFKACNSTNNDQKYNMSTVTDHMANERTYLAWVRTGIAVMALGFVVAKFGIIIKELVPNSSNVSSPFSASIGIVLVLSGGFMQVMALRSFIRNKGSIESGTFKPSSSAVVVSGILILMIAVLLIAYMVLTL
jgi:putative membrane protein